MWYKSAVSLVLAALAAVAPGCTHSIKESEYPEPVKPILVMHGDVSFTKEQQGFVEKAFKTWEKQTAGQASIRVEWDYDVTKEAGNWHVILNHPEEDNVVVAADCAFSEDVGFPKGFCVPMTLGWAGPEDSGGIGIHNLDKDPVTLNLIPTRYDSPERWQSVLIHEVGHIFGLHHNVQDQYAVMWPSNDTRKTCLRQPDLVAFCALNVCDGRKMFPCE